MPSPYARKDWMKEQEANLEYVAITRAMVNLYYIESNCWKVENKGK
jgi:superfamily I DNA/RNA helicase